MRSRRTVPCRLRARSRRQRVIDTERDVRWTAPSHAARAPNITVHATWLCRHVPEETTQSKAITLISTNQLKNGNHIEVDGTIYKVVEFRHVKPGKGPAFVRT